MITLDQLKRGRVFYDVDECLGEFEPVWLKITNIDDGEVYYDCDGDQFERGWTSVDQALTNFVKTKQEAKSMCADAYIKAENAKILQSWRDGLAKCGGTPTVDGLPSWRDEPFPEAFGVVPASEVNE